MTYVIIPEKHQAAPRDRYLPYRKNSSGLYVPKNNLSETELLDGLLIDQSPIHGLGLYANKDFIKHDVIWNEILRGKNPNPQQEGPLRWTNHSDRPNSALIINSNGLLDVSLIALDDIIKGDEITYNYNVFGHTGYEAACNCGNDNCKGSFNLRSEWGERK